MIACEICESPQFLNIIESKIRFGGPFGEEPAEVYEKYECVYCGPTAVGALEIHEYGGKKLTGSITEIEQARPQVDL